MTIVLVGFMGAGKTTVGRLLAARRGTDFVDTDAEIERRTGIRSAEIFAGSGEAYFRTLEREVIEEALESEEGVVALGGGALGDAATRARLAEGFEVVYLRAEADTLLGRAGDDGSRPMLERADPHALLETRLPLYEEAATHVVATDSLSPQEVVAAIERVVGPPVRRIVVESSGGPYSVLVGRGLLDRLPRVLPQMPGAAKALLVSHPELEPLAARAAAALEDGGLPVVRIEIPAGEPSKSLAVAGGVFRELATAAAHRGDLVVALGGGVVTDLAGFVASTFNRGMPLVHVPTSLLAQVDAAVGGKTGINLPEGKNLIGTFYPPRAVICDVDALSSLPEPEVRAGMAEVAKYGFISDPGLLDLCEQRSEEVLRAAPEVLLEVVARSVEIKARIVSADEREAGERAHLNYGHTFGHAIEAAAGYEGLRHGEAVALGMMAAAHLARVLGRIDEDVVDRHRKVLGALGLPVRARLDAEALEEAWLRDKKYSGGVRFVLLAGIGRAEAGIVVSGAEIAEALERLAE